MSTRIPLVLLILDGFGYRTESKFNAIQTAHTPQWDLWWKTKPHILLEASGPCVGLPDNQMGNSEVGHMHIGAGRLIPQDFTRISDAIQQGTYENHPVFLETITEMKKKGKGIHVLGLLSPGGVHSHETHLFAFLTLCHTLHFQNLYLHVFLDGRDTPPQSAKLSITALNAYIKKYKVGQICSITGRYYAMDRDKRWERIESAYRLLVERATPFHFNTVNDALDFFYKKAIYDEFIPPTSIGKGRVIEDGDSIFFFNFRADRARQLTQSLLLNNFHSFQRVKKPTIAHFITMTRYASTLPTEVVFSPLHITNTLGEIIAQHHLRQLRIAETEKYAHVTFFFNAGKEKPFKYEDRILIPSPAIATYDLQPEMSAPRVTETVIEAIKSKQYDIIICNFANADMVGHTGNFTATIKAIEYLDKAMHAIWKILQIYEGQMLITADHGNAEYMFNKDIHQAHTAHTSFPVPLLYLGNKWHFTVKKGTLIDIAPTILSILDIIPPNEMSGRILMKKNICNV